MKLSTYTLLMLLVFCNTTGKAEAATVLGNITCKQWMDRQNKPADSEAYTVWLNGYMSGANAEYGGMLDRDFIKNSDKIPIQDWTDAYCKKYPDAKLDASANALIKLLKRDLPF
jgi:hypothetical protein